MRESGRAAACWREAAAAMRDAGDHERAARLEQKAANAQSDVSLQSREFTVPYVSSGAEAR
jgi:hypothetical protein